MVSTMLHVMCFTAGLLLVAADRTFQAGDVTIEVDEGSGGVELSLATGGRPRTTVHVGLGVVLEVDANSRQVATTGDLTQRHLVDSYDNIDFTVGTLTDTPEGGVAAKKLVYKTQLAFGPILRVTLLVYRADGDVTFGHTFKVRKNDVRLQVALEKWKFCDTVANPCHNASDVGNLIDFFISVDGAEVAEPLDPTPACFLNYRVGAAVVCLPDKVRTNNEWTNQKAGYPKNHPRKDDKDQFVFCFYRPSDSHEADFLFDMGLSLLSAAPGRGTHSAALSAALILALWAYLW